MRPLDLDTVEKAVAAAEATTSAEIIVAVNRRSGSYGDRELVAASLAGLMATALMVLVPWWEFDPVWFLPEAVLVGGIALTAIRFVPPLGRAIAGRRRMDRQASLYARNAFHVLSVSGTRERTGLLVYVSRFEDRVLFIPDFGIEAKVPAARWAEVAARAGPPGRAPDFGAWLAALVTSCGAILTEKLPHGPVNPEELPNRPRLEVL